MIKPFSLLLSLMTYTLISFHLNAEENSKEVIKIAIGAPTTGANAHHGAQMIEGIEDAISTLNQSVAFTFESHVFDDKCETKAANDVANKIVKQGFKFVIGHLCANATLVASSIYQEEELLLISPVSTAQGITTRGYDSIFRSVYLDAQQGSAAAMFIQNNYLQPQDLSKKITADQLLILHNNDVYGKSIVQQLTNALPNAESQLIKPQGFTPSAKAIARVIEDIHNNHIQFIYFAAFNDQMLTLAHALNAANIPVQLMGTNALNDAPFTSNIDTLPPILFTQLKSNEAGFSAIKMQSYAAMQSLASAIQNTTALENSSVKAAFKTQSVNSIMGTLSWADNGDLTTNVNAFEIIDTTHLLK